MLNLFWIFDHIDVGPYGGPLSADCPGVEKRQKFL